MQEICNAAHTQRLPAADTPVEIKVQPDMFSMSLLCPQTNIFELKAQRQAAQQAYAANHDQGGLVSHALSTSC